LRFTIFDLQNSTGGRATSTGGGLALKSSIENRKSKMITLGRILVPTDFSEPARAALLYAAALAEKFGGELVLLHVVQDLTVFLPRDVTGMPSALPPADEMNAAVRDGLTRFVQTSGLGQGVPRQEVREGAPHAQITAFAREAGVDLIVMGTHGRGGLSHMLLGSVTEKVVRTAPCPVLTVREHQQPRGGKGAGA
jgi:nucleotide-binding universal stress UspA family protein